MQSLKEDDIEFLGGETGAVEMCLDDFDDIINSLINVERRLDWYEGHAETGTSVRP